MRILIIGAVASGTSAAAKARRNNEDAEIVIYEKDEFISYSGCGMPYYLGGVIERAEDLAPRDADFFKNKYNVDVFTRHEVIDINCDKKTLQVKDLSTQKVFFDNYDILVIATGAKASVPPIKGVENSNVFLLRNMLDMNKIKSFIDNSKPKTAAIIGTGFIGLEVCENLKRLGIEVSLIEKLPQVTPNLDADMSVYVKKHIEKNGVTVLTNATAQEITNNSVILQEGETIKADMVLVATGVRPETSLASLAGVALGQSGDIRVNEKMQTNIADVYACGDCIEVPHILTGKPVYRPLGSTANKTGRIAGDSITGGDLTFRGVLSTGIFKVFDMTVAQTGLSEREAKEHNYDIVVSHNIMPNKPEYMGGKDMIIKAIADKDSGRLLGVQIVGYEGVDKRIDVFVTAITFGAKVADLFHLDLAYSPPFSTAKDPVMYTGMILENAINRGRKLVTAEGLDDITKSGQKLTIIDARVATQYEKEHIFAAENIPHSKLRECANKIDKDCIVVTYCNRGITGNAAQNILLNKGFDKVYNISGGHKHYKIVHSKNSE